MTQDAEVQNGRVVLVNKSCPDNLSSVLKEAFSEGCTGMRVINSSMKTTGGSYLYKKMRTAVVHVKISEDGAVSFLKGMPEDFSDAQQSALAMAISVILPEMESIGGHRTGGMTYRMALGIHDYCDVSEYIPSGSWHQDGWNDISAIIYFNHENIKSKLSFRKSGSEEILFSSETEKTIKVFNNQFLEHVVHDICPEDRSKPARRQLLTFFCADPYYAPNERHGSLGSSVKEIVESGGQILIVDNRKKPEEEAI
ncbi:MAG TPA: hypothetical protein VJK48_00810 [Chlamydiales bacterium]|nr:MAG: hypothetical protein A3F67_11640 [Verrucomicrobia bacterium RIFCSPHIGHO2_12_FULL_41_10]HLB52234.1 hypothetical protein [Chlamydiales bacterium]